MASRLDARLVKKGISFAIGEVLQSHNIFHFLPDIWFREDDFLLFCDGLEHGFKAVPDDIVFRVLFFKVFLQRKFTGKDVVTDGADNECVLVLLQKDIFITWAADIDRCLSRCLRPFPRKVQLNLVPADAFHMRLWHLESLTIGDGHDMIVFNRHRQETIFGVIRAPSAD